MTLRIALTLLFCVVLCLCLAPAGYAESHAVSDAVAFYAHGVYVNEDNFPDENFRNYVVQKYGTYLSSGEIAAATVIDCSKPYSFSFNSTDIENPPEEMPDDTPVDIIINNPEDTDNSHNYPSTESDNDEAETFYPDSMEGETFYFQSYESEYSERLIIRSENEEGRIKSLKGLEYFTELEELICAGNALSELDLRNNTKLKKLDCSANILSNLDLSSNKYLTTLSCKYNKLSELGLSNNTELNNLFCSYNSLYSLNISNNTALRSINCDANILSNLDLSCNQCLTTLNCAYNKLSELDLSNNTELNNLDCSYNSLYNLNISNNTALRSISCYVNLLRSLDLSGKATLKTINCANNQIEYLNIEDCPLLLKFVMENEPELYDGELHYLSNLGYLFDDHRELDVDETVKLIPINCYAINETNFPDANFLAYVAETFDVDKDSFLCKEEIEAATDLNCSGKAIQSLRGLEFFNKLKNLNCSNNDIEYLTISQSPSLVALVNNVQPEISDNVTMYSDGDACLIYDAATVLMDIVNPLWIINKSNFPDMTFREYVSNVIDLDSNGFLNEDEVAVVTWIDCSGNGEDRGNIKSLQGIEVFSNLELLDCSYNRLRELNVSKNRKLKTLDCSTNYLEGYLDVADNTDLETVWCYGNRLEDVDLGANEKLVELWCNDNQLSLLDISELPGLKVLWCNTNILTELNTTGNPDLETLSCANNRIANLNLDQNTALTTLWCFGNRIEELNLIHNSVLKRLGCYANFMSELDISPCAELCELVDNRSHTVRDGIIYYFDESSNDPVYLQYDDGAVLITPQVPDFTLSASLTSIESEAFAGGAFTYVLVPATVTEIGPRAFAGCPKLRYVELLNPNTGIDLSAFEGVTDVTLIGASETTVAAFADIPGVSCKPAA